MRTLVTGASGFIGTHLVRHLVKCTSEEIATVGRHKGPPGLRHYACALSDLENLKRVLNELRPSIVYHLAGAARPGLSFPEYFESNFLPTATLLEAMESLDEPVTFFLASTVRVYGGGSGPFTEASPLSPREDLAFSKYLAEEAVRHHVERFPLMRALVGRIADCVGPGQPKGFPIPDLCANLTADRPLKKELLPEDLRGFIDVRDLCNVSQKLVASKFQDKFQIYNVVSHSVGKAQFDTSRLTERLTLYSRSLDASLKDYWEWHSHPRA